MIDLHTHTNKSDGTASPGELIDAAVAAGLTRLAITDHDTFDGWEAARIPATNAGLTLIPGVELSTTLDADAKALLPGFRADVHLTSYLPSSAPTGA